MVQILEFSAEAATKKEPSLVVLGIDGTNHMSILAIEPGTKDNADTWCSVFNELKKRGLNPRDVRIGVMDGLPGLENAFKENFSNAVTGRCWVHALKNSLSKAPERLRDSFKMLATLRTTNPIERVNKELKRRTKSMDSIGENTLEILLAFTALRLELGWRHRWRR